MNKQGTEANYYGTKLPSCDVHRLEHAELVEASYDARLKFGSWAYVCEDCFTNYGVRLGVGFGQKLVLKNSRTVV
jgi:hypothetical protein